MTDETVGILPYKPGTWRRREALEKAKMAMDEGVSSRAARLYEASLRANPDGDVTWSRLRHVYEALGGFAEPTRFYLDAIEREPFRPEAYREFGFFLHRVERWADAVPYLTGAFLLDSQQRSVRSLLASGGLSGVNLEAMCMERGQRFPRHRSVEIGPIARLRFVLARNRARDAARANDFETAALRYRGLLRNFPHRPEILVQYGHALKETGRMTAAEAAYRRAYALSGGAYRFALPISHVLELQGDIAAARWICAFAPDDPQAARELERLNRIMMPAEAGDATPAGHRIDVPKALSASAGRILLAVAA